MAHLRAVKAGDSLACQNKLEAQFNTSESIRCLTWIKVESGEDFEIEVVDDKHRVMNNFWSILKDGQIFCKIINKYLPDDQKLDLKSRTFQKAANVNFEANRERERLDKFLQKCVELDIPREALFQIENLYECTNLMAVCSGISALGSEIESRPEFTGSAQWPKKYVDKKAEAKRDKMRNANKNSCTYSGLLFGAPVN